MTSEQTVQRDRAVEQDRDFQDVCALEDVPPGTGVAALVQGEQIAIVRTTHDLVVALSNFDPFSKAFVISRGIVGDRGGIPKIASPIFKQNFSLLTGECLDDPTVKLPLYPCSVVAGRILVSVKRREPS